MLKHWRPLTAFAALQGALFSFAYLVVMMLQGLGLSVEREITYAARYIDWSGKVILTAFERPLVFLSWSIFLQIIMTAGFIAALSGRARLWLVALVGSFVHISTHLFLLSAGLHFVVRSRISGL